MLLVCIPWSFSRSAPLGCKLHEGLEPVGLVPGGPQLTVQALNKDLRRVSELRNESVGRLTMTPQFLARPWEGWWPHMERGGRGRGVKAKPRVRGAVEGPEGTGRRGRLAIWVTIVPPAWRAGSGIEKRLSICLLNE